MFDPVKRADMLRPLMLKNGKFLISRIAGTGEEVKEDEDRIAYSTYFKFKWYIDLPEQLSLSPAELWSPNLLGLVDNPLSSSLRDIKKLEFQNPPFSAAFRMKGKHGDPKDYNRAFTIQLSGCNYNCNYCFVPPETNACNPNFSKYFSVKEIVDYFLKAREDFNEPINVVRVTGGENMIVPEFVIELYNELEKIDGTYLWIDTNLSATKHMENVENELKDVLKRRNVGVTGCFKGTCKEDFSLITGAQQSFFDDQFKAAKLFLDWKTDLYVYLPALVYGNSVEQKIDGFVNMLQALNKNLPLRVEMLIIHEYPAAKRNMELKSKEKRPIPLTDQRKVFDSWYNKILPKYYSKEMLSKFCCEVPL
ncbi:MAG: radical SAM protein [Candidatus Aenigmarchaeota archaeon]|nr:radical SAM protein [Candidatus Aenigmarchaeota archaeon]